MYYHALAMVGGIALFQLSPRLPHPALYLGFIPIAVVLWRSPRWRAVALCGVGFLWAMWRADLILDARLDQAQAGQVLSITGVVATRPIDFGLGKRFDFKAAEVTGARGARLPLVNLKLAWYERHRVVRAGSRCTLKVRLKIPYGTRNPGGFDREKWLFTERVSATGYVVQHPANHCAEPSTSWSLQRVRETIAARIRTSLPVPSQQGVIAGLAVADRDGLSDSQWQVLRTTGTAHLLAISGLHISLVAGIAFFAAHWGIGLVAPVNRRWPVQRPAALAALAAAGAYAALAGFPISTQRALVMLAAAMICQLWRRPSVSFDAYLLALVAVAVFDPTALLSAGFWLSFSAVGWLLFINSTQPPGKTLPRLLQLHVYLALGLTPLLGVLHQSVPLASPLANLVAVPVVTVVVVPLVIAGIAAIPFDAATAGALWRAAAWVWELLWSYLSWLAQVVGSFPLPSAPGNYAIGLALVGVMTFFVPLVRMRWLLGSLLIATLALEQRNAPELGQIRLTVVDVGQGLAVVVETTHKVLVYDTGAAFGRFSAGADILAPVLRSRGIAAVDRLILSHGDADHAGGWAGLAASLPIREIWVSPGHVLSVPTTECLAGQQWQWDGVEFSILYPLEFDAGSRNDRSCVLKIGARGGSVLLPGDIEARAESRLVRYASAELSADILIAPHHGSATSSTVPFVAAVDPAYVVFAAGYKNRFSFPRPEVVSGYLTRGVVPLTTGLEGAIEFTISDRVEAPRGFRRSHLRYWHHIEAPQPVAGR